MRLLTTGGFVRAARHVRLHPTQHAKASSARLRWASTGAATSRRGGTGEQTSPSPFRPHPAHSNLSTLSADSRIPGATTTESRFRAHLQNEAQENTMVTDSTGLKGARILKQAFVFDSTSNLSSSILSLIGRDLYNLPNHPLCITRRLIESAFPYPKYKNHVATNPVVTIKDNFDVLGFPADHPGRSPTDTYHLDSTHVLRTHSSAHQHAAFQYMSKNPEAGYTICADVYRRDSIDRSHFPVFHQMEGAHLWKLPPKAYASETRYDQLEKRINTIRADTAALPRHDMEIIDDAGPHNLETNPVQINHDKDEAEAIGNHLKRSLELLVAKVFTAAKAVGVGYDSTAPVKIRWIEAYFPFTSPSWELEVWWQGEWLELLGSGVVQQSILDNAGLQDRVGWAWGIGIERLAMLLFGIPDIRLFWSQDPRFLKQFKEGTITRFEPFSKYPACYKDVSFWLPSTSPTAAPLAASASSSAGGPGVAAAAGGNSTHPASAPMAPLLTAFHENDLMEIVRDAAGSLAEDVTLVDEFIHPRTGRKSLCYRINYRSLEKTLTNPETNAMHERVREGLVKTFGVELR